MTEMADSVAEELKGRAHPLNSKRLTRAHLQTLARGLELPTDDSAGKLRLMIEEKLEREPLKCASCLCGG